MNSLVRLIVPIVAMFAGAALVASQGGCNRSKTPRAPTTVRGTVVFQGQPLTGGLIVFTPDPDRGASGKPVRGSIGADGRFELRLGSETSIPPGWYRVSIAAAPTLNASTEAIFPAKLSRPDMSGLVREVKPEQENIFNFAVEVEVPIG